MTWRGLSQSAMPDQAPDGTAPPSRTVAAGSASHALTLAG